VRELEMPEGAAERVKGNSLGWKLMLDFVKILACYIVSGSRPDQYH
jgi:hypothetical protein